MECALTEHTAQNRQLAEKSGPYYEEWRRRQMEHLRRLEAGGD